MKKITDRLTAAIMTGMALIAPAYAQAGEGVKVEHLGINNTLVRVTGDKNFIILPIQESIDDAKIDVLVDGKVAETFYARLAQSKTDFTVPYDLSKYKGHNVILNIIANHGRQNIREAKDAVCWQVITLSDTFDTTNTEFKYRPYYHQSPEYGWMNDPNGMVYVNGTWHLFYQWNPYGSKWQNMTWGHATSTDLINWDHHGAAIVPDGLGSIFSGSCVIDRNNTAGFGKDAVIALYTSAAASQIQSLAYSNDNGATFTPYKGNPILTLESEARDPNMFWNDKTKEWNLILAHALDYEMLLFTSPNLKDWTLQSAFGKGLGCQDGVWECPDLFELPVDGTGKKKWALICNINPGGPFGGSATQYFIGDFDGKKFVADTDANGNVPTKWMDFGKDHYATVSWSDTPANRRTVIGWMSNWQYAADVPTTQFRSANTLPRECELFSQPDGQIYLASVPSPELNALRGKVVASSGKKTLSNKAANFSLPSEKNAACEIVADVDAKNASEVTFTISNPKGNKYVMTYNVKQHTISCDRRQSGIVDFSENFPAVTVAPTFEQNGKINLRIFLDSSSVELFTNNGKSVQTNLVFPDEPYTTFSVSSNGKAILDNLKIYAAK
ncbi:MAG: DUF4980 domain-containing protein [Bacteroides sp.]|nr:DUF4980 domain-containing protein [Bacteroides sp.]